MREEQLAIALTVGGRNHRLSYRLVTSERAREEQPAHAAQHECPHVRPAGQSRAGHIGGAARLTFFFFFSFFTRSNRTYQVEKQFM